MIRVALDVVGLLSFGIRLHALWKNLYGLSEKLLPSSPGLMSHALYPGNVETRCICKTSTKLQDVTFPKIVKLTVTAVRT